MRRGAPSDDDRISADLFPGAVNAPCAEVWDIAISFLAHSIGGHRETSARHVRTGAASRARSPMKRRAVFLKASSSFSFKAIARAAIPGDAVFAALVRGSSRARRLVALAQDRRVRVQVGAVLQAHGQTLLREDIQGAASALALCGVAVPPETVNDIAGGHRPGTPERVEYVQCRFAMQHALAAASAQRVDLLIGQACRLLFDTGSLLPGGIGILVGYRDAARAAMPRQFVFRRGCLADREVPSGLPTLGRLRNKGLGCGLLAVYNDGMKIGDLHA